MTQKSFTNNEEGVIFEECELSEQDLLEIQFYEEAKPLIFVLAQKLSQKYLPLSP
jgi:hypothetical protein